jgi:hypothetical protein
VKRKRKVILGTLIIAAVLVITALFFLPSPVLLRYKDSAEVDPAGGLIVILNPTRNRQPEQAATVILHLLKDGKCEDVVTAMPGDDRYKGYICGKEKEHHLTDWQLVDRTDGLDGSLLHYKAYREDYPAGLYGNIWMRMAEQGGTWKLTSYEAWY